MNTVIKKITFNINGELAATFSPDGEVTISISKVSSVKCGELYNTFLSLDRVFTEYLAAPFNITLSGIKKSKKDGKPFYQFMFSANINGIATGCGTEWLTGEIKQPDGYDHPEFVEALNRHNAMIAAVQNVEHDFIKFIQDFDLQTNGGVQMNLFDLSEHATA